MHQLFGYSTQHHLVGCCESKVHSISMLLHNFIFCDKRHGYKQCQHKTFQNHKRVSKDVLQARRQTHKGADTECFKRKTKCSDKILLQEDSFKKSRKVHFQFFTFRTHNRLFTPYPQITLLVIHPLEGKPPTT